MKSFRFEPLCSRFIIQTVRLFSVVTAIQLNDQLGSGTVKIDDILTNRLLASKAQTTNLLSAQI